MDTAVVVGNCQAQGLELFLQTSPSFVARYELVKFPPVHEISPELIPDLHDAVGSAALVLAQRIDEGYRDGIGLGTATLAAMAGDATFIRWPSVYWAGYFPDLFYLRDEAGRPVADGPFDYHDRVIFDAFGSLEPDAVEQVLRDPDVPSQARDWAQQATAELTVRGEECDIDVATFIAARYTEELLFFTMNHPSNSLLEHIAAQALALTGLPPDLPPEAIPPDVLGSTFYPLHANHVRALGLSFGSSYAAGAIPFRVRGREVPPRQAIEFFFDNPRPNPRVVLHTRRCALVPPAPPAG
jgi:hypothetical protein